MTDEQPASGNDTAMSALKEHVADMHHMSVQLTGLIEVIDFLENEDACVNGRICLTNAALRLARDLTTGLDSVKLPGAKQ
ncbi:hypothetical protein AB9K41_23170 [Cribrihabitans sp. XS_ASV171]